ncbi:hypothetical protein ACHQM5_019767 [Ranunculus cassubicifolius]
MSLDFNEDDYPEYDRTPYDGGYDISTTYGKPLSPSEKICYPRAGSVQNSSSPPVKDLSNEKPKPIPQIESLPPFADNNLSKKPDFHTPVESNSGKESPQFGNDYVPNGNGYSDPSEEIGDYDYGGEENGYTLGQVPLPPSEYVEPCASLFGYWPCLVKDYREKALQQCCKDRGYGDGWRKAEDYFFGSSYSYGGRRDDYVDRVDYNYGYQKHSIEQPTYVQEHYDPHSQKLSSHVDGNYGYEKHYTEHPTHVPEHYNQDLQKLSTHVDINYGYEKHYMEQPTYVQEDYNQDLQKLSTHVDINYAYEKHHMEQPTYLSTHVDINYGYEKHYMEQLTYVQEEYNSQLSKQVEDNYVYNKHYMEQPSYVQEDLWPEKLNNQVDVDYGYDKYNTRHPTYVEGNYDDYNPQSWSQMLSYSYYEA